MATGYEVEYYHAVANISQQMKRLADSQEEIVKVAVPALLDALQRLAERLPESSIMLCDHGAFPCSKCLNTEIADRLAQR